MPELWGGIGPASPAGVLSVSARKLTYQALRDLGVLRAGNATSPELYDDGLTLLNELLDSWSTERLTVFSSARSVFDLAADQGTYTLGPGGDWDIATRPVRIERAGLVHDASECPLEILTDAKWAAVTVKNLTGTVPAAIWSDGAFPLANVSVWPVPTQANQVALYAWQTHTLFSDLDTEYSLPPGYALALRQNLAVQLVPSAVIAMKTAGVLMDDIRQNARMSKAAIKRANMPRLEMQCDAALLRRNYRAELFG